MDNQQQYQLLQTNPQQLLTEKLYQDKLKQVVLNFVKRGFFNYQDVDDVIQEMNELFLSKKLTDIQRSYNPKFGLLIHYFGRAVYNKCVDFSQKKSFHQSNQLVAEPAELQASADYSVASGIELQELLKNERNRLMNYLRLFPKQKSKLVLLLKLYGRLILIKVDLSSFYPQITPKELTHYLSIFGTAYLQKTDKSIYEDITPLINAQENKKNTIDAIRKWFQDRVSNIIEALNRNSTYDYDKESLKNLIQIALQSPLEQVKTGI